MLKLGFDQRWVAWMLMCVSSVHYAISVNHDEVGPVFPGRELCQGDPLSPYLYILCVEGLTSLIRKAEQSSRMHGVCVCRGAPLSLTSCLPMTVFCFSGPLIRSSKL